MPSSLKMPMLMIIRLLDHAALLTTQATALAANFLTHHLSGPRKPSWPIQLTLMCAAMRNITEHTHLVDVETLRRVITMFFAFTPSDIIVTPVSFKIINRGLQGILKDLDEKEGSSSSSDCRVLSGEWVVPKPLWIQMNDEFHKSSANHKHIYVDQDGIKWSNEKVILYIHGGAYYLMSARTHRDLNYRLSQVTRRRVFAINYRLAPEGPFPCGLHDAVHSFLYLTDPNGLAIQPQNIIIAGDSAGGGLTLALLFYLRDNHMPLPGESDPLNPVKLYLDPHEERANLAKNPYVSPLFGDLNHLPPLLIQCGDSEVLHDEICLLANKASETGTTFVQHEVYEATKAMDSVGYFVKNIIPIHQRNILLSQTYHHSNYSIPGIQLPSP
ncbi:10955_t:CDS:2 [Entrophospora sp. SA101]|nr:10955_t:CDS:2 [Entrophospora sp. SA101]